MCEYCIVVLYCLRANMKCRDVFRLKLWSVTPVKTLLEHGRVHPRLFVSGGLLLCFLDVPLYYGTCPRRKKKVSESRDSQSTRTVDGKK